MDFLKGFFAYSSYPATLPETISAAVKEINKSRQVHLKTWEECRVGGKVIMQEICNEIIQAELFCADLTGINPNVMFELGYAIARNKRIWLLLDPTLSESRNDFNQLKLLTTIGYAQYTNSDDITKSFYKDKPFIDLENTIFNQSIKPNLSPIQADQILLYLKSRHDTEPSNRITKRIQNTKIPLIVDDPRESAIQTLSWYGQKIYGARGVLCHLTGPAREGARLHNARYALVSGLTFGFSKSLLMLSEGDYLAPIDYRDLLKCYRTASESIKYLEEWLLPLEENSLEGRGAQLQYAEVLKLATELKGFQLKLGEHVAENEAEGLVHDYFVETTPYLEALEGRQTIFIGRKGTGKTANLLKLATTLKEDRGNLVCVIKPAAYEIESLVRLFNGYNERDTKGYVIESLWKFLLYTEMAYAIEQEIGMPQWQINDELKSLLHLLDEKEYALRGDFAVRLERCIESLFSLKYQGSVEQFRKGISEVLHEGVLKELRITLGNVLAKKKRVAILVDNLDKAWTKRADLDHLSEFLLGLLAAGGRVAFDFKRSDSRKYSVNVSLAVFLRSDIFSKVTEVAREPDKLSHTRLIWDDPELLSRIVEERFISSHGGSAQPSELWTRYFCPTVKRIQTQKYIIARILPRPRDIVFLVKTAVSIAINRGHTKVEEKDILDAEQQYSQYAIDSIMVENGVTLPELESILYEFAGCQNILTEQDVRSCILKAIGQEEKLPTIVDHLVNLTFLGSEIEEGRFAFSDDPREYLKNNVLANRLVESRGGPKLFKINPAFCTYLEVKEA